MKHCLYALILSSLCAVAAAADLKATVELPQLDVAEYHRPYVATWIENDRREVVANLAVWYDVRMDGEEGEKWLKDLRQWWRRAGRSLDMPVDGVSAATRPPGTHSMQFRGDRGLIAGLPPGRYTLVVEAAREVGGREVLQLPFDWPPTATVTDQAEGERELGSVRLELLP
ncbi:DUF2271 domain-containing protein [Abyssibacter sp.]|jgi:hypothetical protein|uniref:DUF2271 domain-containing protein n=1 Tax=Abyssibacter sp. TaxID=2320200 RepID=UPI0025BD8524|nr:DUF2271 domain-containing protein [Abyssibacter sp.]MCK5860588.1 DUF2271 domain-containing protein [Abyssibacter sp.]